MSKYPRVVWLQPRDKQWMKKTDKGTEYLGQGMTPVLAIREEEGFWIGIAVEDRRRCEPDSYWSEKTWEEVQP